MLNTHIDETTCIVLITDSNYLRYTSYLVTKIHTVQETSVKIFVLTLDVSKEDFCNLFKFTDVEQIQFNLQSLVKFGIEPQGHVSIASYAKILISRLIPKEFMKCLYLDIDIYVVDDLQPILDFPLNRAIAANQFDNGEGMDLFGTYHATYFSAGLLIIDLARWRQELVSEGLIDLLQKFPKLPRGDNDLLNIYFRENWQPLPLTFNFMAELPLNGKLYNRDITPLIVHLVGARKPWGSRGHTIWHTQYRSEFLDLFPGELKLTRADSVYFRFLRSLAHKLPLLVKLVPRKFKDKILIFGEK